MNKQTNQQYSIQSSPIWKQLKQDQILPNHATQASSLNSKTNSTNSNSCYFFKEEETKLSPQRHEAKEINALSVVFQKDAKIKIRSIMLKYSTPRTDRLNTSSLLVSQSCQSDPLSPQPGGGRYSLNKDINKSLFMNDSPLAETNKRQKFQQTKNGGLMVSCSFNKNLIQGSQFSPFQKGKKSNRNNLTLSALFENDKSQNYEANTRKLSNSQQYFSSFIEDSSLVGCSDFTNQVSSPSKPVLDFQYSQSSVSSPQNQSKIQFKPNQSIYVGEIGLFGNGKFRVTQQTSERNAMKNQVTVTDKPKQNNTLKQRKIGYSYLPKENNRQVLNEALSKDVLSKQFVIDYLNSAQKTSSPHGTSSIDNIDNTSEKQDYVEDISFFQSASYEKEASQVLFNDEQQFRIKSRNDNKSLNVMSQSKSTIFNSKNCLENNRYIKQQFLSSFKRRSTFKISSKLHILSSAQDILTQQIEIAQNLPFGDVIDKKKLSYQANKTLKKTNSVVLKDDGIISQQPQQSEEPAEFNLLRLMSPSNNISNKSRASRRSIGPNTMGQDSKLFRQFVSQNQRKKLIPQQVRLALKKAIYYLRSLDVAPKDLLTQKVFSSKPFEKPFSYDLIQAAKFGNVLKVKECLNENRYLVFDFDYIYLTALHWASKRNHLQIVEILLKNGSDVNSKDIMGRTPLFFAIEQGFEKICYLLLEKKASPWSTPQVDYVAAAKENVRILTQLNKFKKINIIVSMSPFSKREQIWEKQIQLFHY